jgi:hypothetical protein
MMVECPHHRKECGKRQADEPIPGHGCDELL